MTDFNSPTPGSGQEKINSSTARDEPRRRSANDASLINSKNRSSRADTTRANRELDAEVMAGVFKREIKWWRGEPSYLGEDSGWKTESTVPRFSLDLVAAFNLAEQFKYGWRATRYATDKNFHVTFYRSKNDPDGLSAVAATLPLAFCLAALRALDA